jgi:hypothetical protein
MQYMQHPLVTQEEKFFYKLTFFAFRNLNQSSCSFMRMVHPPNNNYFYFKGENHEEAKGNAVDGGRRTRSGRSGIGCSSRLLCITGLLRFLFW